MSVRLPLQTVIDQTFTDLGSGSVAGGWAYPFQIPMDTDNIVVKFDPSVVGATLSATLQTSDDGGTTYFDVARTPTLAATQQPTALWLSAPVISSGVRSSGASTSTSILGTIGQTAASTLAAGNMSGLPILGIQNRVFVIATGNITTNSGSQIQVKVNSQSATA